MQIPEVHEAVRPEEWLWASNILENKGHSIPRLTDSSLLICEDKGFLLGCIPQGNLAFLSYIFVESEYRRQGVANALLNKFIQISNTHSINQIVIPGFTGNAPGYIQPGVNVETELEALRFFSHHGFKEIGKVSSMERSLYEHIEIPEDDQWEIRHPDVSELGLLFDAISRSVPGGWAETFNQRFALNSQLIFIAVNDGRIGAYSTWRESRFGPIGVLPEFRGKGLGRLILAHSLEKMRQQGDTRAWFSWSDEENLNFYQSFGFSITKNYSRLALDL
jgi:GNAT superfamily N-acetyltransferase